MSSIEHKKVNKTLDFTGQVCYSVYVGEEIGFSLTSNKACERAKEKEEDEESNY